MPAVSNAPAKLIRLLDYHERAAAAIRLAIELLDADARGSSTSRASATINAAIGLDAMRHAARHVSGNGRGPGKMITRAMVDKAIGGRGSRGPYKKRRSTAPAAKHPQSSWGEKKKQRRTESLEFLNRFDRNEPRVIPNRGLGSYVRRGYLAKRGDGYVRTAKEYEV